jgi:hypothetical protein
MKDGEKAVQLARSVIEQYVKSQSMRVSALEGIFLEHHGVFVTLHTFPSYDLRGCIGIPLPVMPLQEAIIEAAKSATRDPRFLPLGEDEIDTVIIEVTILTKPQMIEVTDPKEYPSKIEIGRDGLIVEQGPRKGLLLPQVPIEQKWSAQEFLSNTCMKAWLSPDAWFDKETKIYKFSGQIFSEVKPLGEIKEKYLNGSDS